MSAMKNRFFFLHMPKCAGTSVRALLEQQTTFYYTTHTATEMSMRAERYYRSFLGVGGHFPLRHAYRLGFAQAWRFTFLRDPIERLISHLTFAAYREPPVFDQDHFRPTVDAIKTHLAGDLLCQATSYHNSYNIFLGTTLDERAPADEQTQSSIANLRSFEFIGFQDTLDEDLKRLFSLLTLDLPIETPRENIASARAQALKNEIISDRECADLIQECTKADREIYQAARSWREGGTRQPARLSASYDRVCRPLDLAAPDINISECALASPTPLAPGAKLDIEILLEISAQILLFDVIVTIKDQLDSRALFQIYTYLETQAHFKCGPATSLITVSLPCPLNEGGYIGHIKVLSPEREVIAEKNGAFSFHISHAGSAPRQFGVCYSGATITANDATQTRRLPLNEACKLTLMRGNKAPISVVNKACSIPLIVKNDSAFEISSGVGCRCFVSYHLLDREAKIVLFDGVRHGFPPIPANTEYPTVLNLEIPDTMLVQTIQVRFVQERVRWHEGPDFSTMELLDFHLDHQGTGLKLA